MFLLGLEMSQWMVGILVVLFVFISLLLMMTILIQKPQGGGLAGAFGSGAGSGQTAFGAKTGDALTIATISIFAFWILFGVGLNYALTPPSEAPSGSVVEAGKKGDKAPPSADEGTPPAATEPNAEGSKSPVAPKPIDTPADQTPKNPDNPAAKPSESAPAPAPAPAPVTTPTPPTDKPAETPPATTPPLH